MNNWKTKWAYPKRSRVSLSPLCPSLLLSLDWLVFSLLTSRNGQTQRLMSALFWIKQTAVMGSSVTSKNLLRGLRYQLTMTRWHVQLRGNWGRKSFHTILVDVSQRAPHLPFQRVDSTSCFVLCFSFYFLKKKITFFWSNLWKINPNQDIKILSLLSFYFIL